MAKISVVIPSRCRPAMLREAVESVLGQTYRPIEIIIVLTGADGATTDAARWLEHLYPTLIRVLETPPRNLATTRNAGMTIATGEWIAFLDDDDIWLPTKLEKQLAKATETGADVVTTNWERFNERGRIDVWGPSDKLPLPFGLSLPEELMLQNRVSVGSLIRLSALESAGGFDPKMNACEDWDCWRRLSHQHQFAYIGEVLMRVRIHHSNMSKNRWLMLKAGTRHFIKMHFDTPARLRHILSRARRMLVKEAFGAVYEAINDRTDDSARKAVRRLRGALR